MDKAEHDEDIQDVVKKIAAIDHNHTFTVGHYDGMDIHEFIMAAQQIGAHYVATNETIIVSHRGFTGEQIQELFTEASNGH